MFHVGQIVVCVDDQWHSNYSCPLRKGTVYTVARVSEGDYLDFSKVVGRGSLLLLVEVQNTSSIGELGIDDGFRAGRFRPVNPKRIEVFTSLLVNPPREDVSA